MLSRLRPEPAIVEAQINYFDSNVDDSWRSNRFGSSTKHRIDKWPHLTRLHSQLHQDMLGDSLPPYIKKYNRRNKQLIGLLEGQGMPNVDSDLNRRTKPVPPPSQQQRQKQKQQQQPHANHERWIEMNLFEAQLNESNGTKTVTPTTDSVQPPIALSSQHRYFGEKNIQSEPNGLPGEHLSLSIEETRRCDDDDLCVMANSGSVPFRPKSPRPKMVLDGMISPRADSFLYHRVATPKVVGTAAAGYIKQKLPFVALTDKRIEDGTRQRRTNVVQNTFPLQ